MPTNLAVLTNNMQNPGYYILHAHVGRGSSDDTCEQVWEQVRVLLAAHSCNEILA